MKYGRTILKDVEGYIPGEQPKNPTVIKLNTNENPYPPSPAVDAALKEINGTALRKYPDPMASAFRRACARQYGYADESWVIAGNGMDEVLAMAIRTFVDPGDTILMPYPTYTLYETLARLHGAVPQALELDEHFQLTEEFYTASGRMFFLPCPNAPSGVQHPKAAVERLCECFNGIIFLDEAYVDFADESYMDLPQRFENVIVGRTFSKSFSLAGMRIGIGVAQPALIREFLKTKDSYNMNAVSQVVGLAAIQDYAYMQDTARRVRQTRARLTQALRERGFHIPDSQANFVLAQWTGTPSAKEIFQELKKQDIYVRYFDAPRLDNALRITVGTDQEIDRLLDAIDVILS